MSKQGLTVLILSALVLTLVVQPAGVASLVASADDSPAPQKSTTGPAPPPGVEPKTLQPMSPSQITLTVPGYLWRHGCGPTALGMVVGYYDIQGYPDLFPGGAATQTADVDQGIASQRNAADPAHYEDYSLPLDSGGSILPDKSELPEGDEHTDDCIADFMRTSWSIDGMRYGWSWSSNIGPAFLEYVNLRNPTYTSTFQDYHMYDSTLTWAVLTQEIDAGRPMVFLVDSDGNGGTDHFVTAVGYDTSAQQYGCLDTWSPADVIRWCDFAAMANGQPWGIWGGWSFSLDSVRYELTMAADPVEGGTAIDLTGESPYEEGTDVSIQAVAEEGYIFAGWTATAGGFADDQAELTTFTMPGENATVTANFIGTVEIQLSLKAGWNMVSVPVTPTDNSTSAVFPDIAAIYAWNATSRSYYVPSVIEPEKGYWVAVAENTTITINGTPVETWTTDIKAGWNMIGSVITVASIASPSDDPDSSVVPPVYWWDPVERKYVETTDIEPGKGYWVASVNDCALTL